MPRKTSACVQTGVLHSIDFDGGPDDPVRIVLTGEIHPVLVGGELGSPCGSGWELPPGTWLTWCCWRCGNYWQEAHPATSCPRCASSWLPPELEEADS